MGHHETELYDTTKITKLKICVDSGSKDICNEFNQILSVGERPVKYMQDMNLSTLSTC